MYAIRSYYAKREEILANFQPVAQPQVSAGEQTSGETSQAPELDEEAAAARDEALAAVDDEESLAALRNSLAGRFGIAMEGVSGLAGFEWRTNIALAAGFAAKEVFVATLGTSYSLGEVVITSYSIHYTKLYDVPL